MSLYTIRIDGKFHKSYVTLPHHLGDRFERTRVEDSEGSKIIETNRDGIRTYAETVANYYRSLDPSRVSVNVS